MSGCFAKEEVVQVIREQLAVDSHLKFVERLINQHGKNLQNGSQLLTIIEKIKRREDDHRLYLGTVGEFSSGKSTLINALIRDDLLRTDVLPATTAAATMMQYGNELDVKIKTLKGEEKSFLKDGISVISKVMRFFSRPSFEKEKDNIHEFLHSVSADEKIAKQVQQVTVEHPSAVLKNGLVIIDTPGTNTDNERHTTVAKWAIEEVCDAALIVIPAPIPVSQSIVQFLNNNLSDVLHRCIFVVTKMDQIRERERSVIIKNIETRLCQALDLKQINLLAVAPQVVVDNFNVSQQEEDQGFLEQFNIAEKSIHRILQSQRVLIQMEKIILLQNTLYSHLCNDLQRMEKEYQEKHNALIANQIANLSDFVSSQKKVHSNNIQADKKSIESYAKQVVDDLRKEVVQAIEDAINQAEDSSQLKWAVTQYTDQILENVRQITSETFFDIQERLQNSGKKELEKFETDFVVLYKSLATLGGRIKISDELYKNMMLSTLENEHGNLSLQMKELVSRDEGETTVKTVGGAGVGAVIGSFIFPGVGTFIGGALGSLIGSLFGPSLDELKARYKNEMNSKICEAFSATQQSSIDGIGKMTNEIISNLNRVIDMYFAQYDKLIQEMIRRDEQEAKQLSCNREVITSQIKEIFDRQEQILHIQERLKNIQGCA